ncbi:MAG: hypothetical protein A2075_19320 [Geobacteraceae bacterium GWC2_58_44]|nr:MAG: hypothetical protein A2075_19320 [Geobacteraceae bacterium GWC2_58_44]
MLLALMVVFIGGCSTYPDISRQRLETLPQRYSQFDLVLAWETKVVGDQTLVEGAAKNVRYAYMYDLEIWVAVMDAAGKVVARSMTFVIPSQLSMDEITEFGLKLPVAVAPGTRLRFTYKYRSNDGGDGDLFGGGLHSGMNWMQSFDAVVPTPSPPLPLKEGEFSQRKIGGNQVK